MMKREMTAPLENEQGFVLVLAMVMIVVLTMMGIAGTSNTIIELMVAGNEQVVTNRFFAADSGWKQAGPYLNSLPTFPDPINLTKRAADPIIDWDDEYYRIVRNYGNGIDGTTNDVFADGSQDGIVGVTVTVPYWYRAIYNRDLPAIGFGTNFRNFFYDINGRAAATAAVDTAMSRVYKLGY